MGNVSRIGVLIILLIGASPLVAEPFGVATVPAAPDSRISAIWRDLQPAMRADEQTIVVCRANPACGSPAALRFIAIVDEARRYQGRALLGHQLIMGLQATPEGRFAGDIYNAEDGKFYSVSLWRDSADRLKLKMPVFGSSAMPGSFCLFCGKLSTIPAGGAGAVALT